MSSFNFKCNCGKEYVIDTYITDKSLVEGQKSTTNTGSPKLPTLEEAYKAIPFPEDERECAMFVAGLAECHKFICRQLRASA
jgi:hypothetical protein